MLSLSKILKKIFKDDTDFKSVSSKNLFDGTRDELNYLNKTLDSGYKYNFISDIPNDFITFFKEKKGISIKIKGYLKNNSFSQEVFLLDSQEKRVYPEKDIYDIKITDNLSFIENEFFICLFKDNKLYIIIDNKDINILQIILKKEDFE